MEEILLCSAEHATDGAGAYYNTARACYNTDEVKGVAK
jgi:hypothetical protein